MNAGDKVAQESQPVALVTGAGARRVGRAIAERLAADGYRIALHAATSIAAAHEAARAFEDRGVEALPVQADVRDAGQVEAMFAAVLRRFGRLDVVVNSAAIWEPGPLEQVTAEDVRRHFEINTLGTFLCCQRGGLILAGSERGGVIVNLGDWATVRPYRNYAAYFPSKGAIPTLTRTMAVELAARNPRVRVNAVLPGPVMLPRDLPEEDRRAAIAGTLVKREGTPEHVADAVSFLVRNDFITGVCLPVDGGRSVYGGD